MDCSSGLSRLPNGRPYWIPTARSAAAPARMATSAVPAPPQRVSAQRSAARRRRDSGCGDGVADDDCIDSRPFELFHVVAARARQLRNRELPCRKIGKQFERMLERIDLVVVTDGEQDDLRIESLQRQLELFCV